MTDMKPDLDWFLAYWKGKWAVNILSNFQYFFAALFGGFVKVLGDKKPPGIRMYVAGIFTAAFAGLIMNEISLHYELNNHLLMVVVALSGYCCFDILRILTSFIKNLTKKILKKLENNK